MAQRGRYLPVEILKRIDQMARDKKTQIEIAGKIGIARTTVRRHFPTDVEVKVGRPAKKEQ